MDKNELLEKISINVVQGRIEKDDEGLDEDLSGQPGVRDLIGQAIDDKVEVSDLLETLRGAMDVVGGKYESGEYFIPDMLASAEAVSVAMELLAPVLTASGHEGRGTVVIATVKGDLHDIGKNIAALMMKGAGWTVVDLGTDVSPQAIADAVKKEKPVAVGMSALLTTTMDAMGDTVKKLEQEGIRNDVKVLIGGAPITEEFAKNIGADKYCPDAFAGVAALE
jgi:5-methyltetrahydrofolate--homocysteine methyltransferase